MNYLNFTFSYIAYVTFSGEPERSSSHAFAGSRFAILAKQVCSGVFIDEDSPVSQY